MSAFAIAFIVYTGIIVVIGLASAFSARRSSEDYFLAGRGLGPWIAALSASASSESGWVTLGLVGMGYESGVLGFWIVPGCLLGYIFNWFVLARRMRRRSGELGALTLPEFFSRHFAERVPALRGLTVLVVLVSMWMYVAAQFNATGQAFGTAFGLSYPAGVAIGTALVLVYTVLGGFRSTCWTDAAQALLMLATLVVFPIFVLMKLGGFETVHESIAPLVREDGSAYLSWWPQASGLALLGFVTGSGALGINLGFPGQPHVLVRFKALRAERDAITGGIIACIWGTLVLAGAVSIGILVRSAAESGAAWAPGADQSEVGLVLAAQELLPGVLSGVVLAAVLAAMCSTADSQLVVAGSAVSHDLVPSGVRTSRAAPWINRGAVLLLGLGAMGLALDTELKVYEFVVGYAWAVLGAAFGPQITLILLWRRATYAGCLTGMTIGFMVPLLWKLMLVDQFAASESLAPLTSFYNLTVAFVLALLGNVIVSLCTTPRAATTT